MGNKYYQPAGKQQQQCVVHLQLALVLRLWGCQFPLASAQLPVTLGEAANKKCNLHEDKKLPRSYKYTSALSGLQGAGLGWEKQI